VLMTGAVAISVLALRSLVRPAAATNRHYDHEYGAARAIVDAYGTDSLSPFLLRPDKALAFAAGGVLAYRVIGGTAVISADPVAPDGSAGEVLAAFQDQARRRGWQIALWGAAETYLETYRALGLHAVCVGEEAFVDPQTFTLEGRSVRKLRQSVHRVARRGWTISAYDGREIDSWLETEIELVSARWSDEHPQVHGFAMGMGSFSSAPRADDLYVLARSPDGELGGVMRFVTCGALLSLDTMQRVGETPNGLNEALVARALEEARARGVAEVSLNYAGLAHLVRREPSRNAVARVLTKVALGPLHRRFQMDRLVRFNEKFSPRWRPRYLVYESRAALPLTIGRVLQAEGYLPHRERGQWAAAVREGLPEVVAARLRPPGPIGQAR
ncbi:MAG TPA: phosphatidylglycerol lysyltransferase domain-containing protein, partial [Solirubrobacteraceae bacterium]|nr:phosphatidylglycerol lysyltransferase domain-containing protein [Solirubrobacteraceae bacterium]